MTNFTKGDPGNILVYRLKEIVTLGGECLVGMVTSCITEIIFFLAAIGMISFFVLTFIMNPVGFIGGTILFGFSGNLTAAVICYFGFYFMLRLEISLRIKEQNTFLQESIAITE